MVGTSPKIGDRTVAQSRAQPVRANSDLTNSDDRQRDGFAPALGQSAETAGIQIDKVHDELSDKECT